MPLTDLESLRARFRDLYGLEAEFSVRAPGRVNLIGEHTDYNDGFVLPAAIDFDVAFVGSRRPDRQVRAYSEVFRVSDTFSLDDLSPSKEATWSNYIRGIADQLLTEHRKLNGMNCVVAGTVPIGSGLSSSAAMEIAACLAFEAASGFDLNPLQRALTGQMAEQNFLGLKVGIMDEFVSALGRKDHALFIDTRSLEYESVLLPTTGVSILIADTRKPRELVDSEYNVRRAQCEEAVEILTEYLPEIKALRDVSVADLDVNDRHLPNPLRARARHVVTENDRVLRSVDTLKRGALDKFGQLMNESHDSLRTDYEVSCPELDTMVDLAREVHGVYGSRMTGAGFGGCTVSLVSDSAVKSFEEYVGPRYRDRTGLEPAFYICRASDGARRVE